MQFLNIYPNHHRPRYLKYRQKQQKACKNNASNRNDFRASAFALAANVNAVDDDMDAAILVEEIKEEEGSAEQEQEFTIADG